MMVWAWLTDLICGRRRQPQERIVILDFQSSTASDPPEETPYERAQEILNLSWAVLAAEGEEKRRLEADLKARYGVEILD